MLETNFRLRILVNLKELLDIPILTEFFESGKKRLYKWKSRKQFINSILENYKTKYKAKKINNFRTVDFNIKNNNIYENWVIRFEDNIFNSIFIPYDIKVKDDYFSSIGSWITIRLLVVNGLLKLQIWSFYPKSTDNIVSTERMWSDEYYTYIDFYDITTFPLKYFVNLKLPLKYRNINAEWIEWYYSEEGSMQNRDRVPEWQEIHREIKNYSYLQCLRWDEEITINNVVDSKAKEILKEFESKKERELVDSGFNEDDTLYSINNWYIQVYRNNIVYIEILDYNDRLSNNYSKASSNYIKQEFYP